MTRENPRNLGSVTLRFYLTDEAEPLEPGDDPDDYEPEIVIKKMKIVSVDMITGHLKEVSEFDIEEVDIPDPDKSQRPRRYSGYDEIEEVVRAVVEKELKKRTKKS